MRAESLIWVYLLATSPSVFTANHILTLVLVE